MHFEMSMISTFYRFPLFHFCTVKTDEDDLLNSDSPTVIGHIFEATEDSCYMVLMVDNESHLSMIG